MEALTEHEGTVTVGGRIITNLHFADNINVLAGKEEELTYLVYCLKRTSCDFGKEISAEKTKFLSDEDNQFTTDITVSNQKTQKVTRFKYLGSVITHDRCKTEILSRKAQTTATMTKIKTIQNNRNISTIQGSA